MEKSVTPLNGIVEPDFLEYLDKTFKRWQQLAAQGVTLGSREIAKLTDTVYGAKLNARYGFEAVARREPDEEGQDRFTLMIYKNREAVENDPPGKCLTERHRRRNKERGRSSQGSNCREMGQREREKEPPGSRRV